MTEQVQEQTGNLRTSDGVKYDFESLMAERRILVATMSVADATQILGLALVQDGVMLGSDYDKVAHAAIVVSENQIKVMFVGREPFASPDFSRSEAQNPPAG